MDNPLETAIESLRPGLGADGFRLEIEDTADGRVTVGLTALPDACLDCLVPDEILTRILQDAVDKSTGTKDLTVVLVKHGFENVEAH